MSSLSSSANASAVHNARTSSSVSGSRLTWVGGEDELVAASGFLVDDETHKEGSQMIWDNFFTAGGYGMYPISIDGFLLLAAALFLALRPERRLVPLVISLALLTLGSGVLGTVVGIVTTLHYVARVPTGQVQALVMGTAEASHCLVLALLLVIAALGLASIAAWRVSHTVR